VHPDVDRATGATGPEPVRRFGTRALIAAALFGLFAGLVMGTAVAPDDDPAGDGAQGRTPSATASSAAARPSTAVASTTSTPPAAGPVMAQARLRGVPADSVGSGLARLVGDPARPALDVTSELPGTTGFYQVWLADRDLGQLYALGILDAGGAGIFLVPPGIDLAVHTVVDISAEPLDGDPAHSGTGMLRGELG
jgi:hypothetical protein